MTCHELSDFLLDYVSNELPDATREIFERHLSACPDCRRYLDSYRKTIAMSRAAFAAPPARCARSAPSARSAAFAASAPSAPSAPPAPPALDAAEVPDQLIAAILKARCGRR